MRQKSRSRFRCRPHTDKLIFMHLGALRGRMHDFLDNSDCRLPIQKRLDNETLFHASSGVPAGA
jgi:hypothetical protein